MRGFRRFFGARSCDANTKHCLVIVAKRIIESLDFLRREQCESKDQSKRHNVEFSVQNCSEPTRKNAAPFYFNFLYEVDDEKVPIRMDSVDSQLRVDHVRGYLQERQDPGGF